MILFSGMEFKKVRDVLERFLWIGASFWIWRSFDCGNILESQDLKMGPFRIGITCFIICAVIFIGFQGYISYVIKSEKDIDEHFPIAIPVATFLFLAGGLSMNIALWPVYSWYTFPMLFTFFMGFVCTVAFIPGSSQKAIAKKQD